MRNMQPSPETSDAKGVAVKTYRGVGIVEKVDRQTGILKINHEEIKGYMPAMSMEYPVKDKSLLTDLKAGDQVTFILEDSSGIVMIVETKKSY
jgi:Cu/Ag efflux protein CusF